MFQVSRVFLLISEGKCRNFILGSSYGEKTEDESGRGESTKPELLTNAHLHFGLCRINQCPQSVLINPSWSFACIDNYEMQKKKKSSWYKHRFWIGFSGILGFTLSLLHYHVPLVINDRHL